MASVTFSACARELLQFVIVMLFTICGAAQFASCTVQFGIWLRLGLGPVLGLGSVLGLGR